MPPSPSHVARANLQDGDLQFGSELGGGAPLQDADASALLRELCGDMYIDASQLDQVVSPAGSQRCWSFGVLRARSLGVCDACTGGRRCAACHPKKHKWQCWHRLQPALATSSILPATSSVTGSRRAWLAGAAGAGRVCNGAEVPAAAASVPAAAAAGAPRRQALPWPHAAGSHALIPQAVFQPLAGERLFVVSSGLRDMG